MNKIIWSYTDYSEIEYLNIIFELFYCYGFKLNSYFKSDFFFSLAKEFHCPSFDLEWLDPTSRSSPSNLWKGEFYRSFTYIHAYVQ